MKWTTDQKKVIEERNRDILVSAAAGSGKTAVLVERIIHRVLDISNPCDIDRLLVLTFTKDAANEMKERVRKSLLEKLKKDPQNKRLKRQSILVNYANISTIDSFCTYIVKNYFNNIDVDPSFRIIDEAEKKIIIEEAMEELFYNNYNLSDKENNKSFYNLISTYKEKNRDTKVREIVYLLFEKSQNTLYPLKWISNLEKNYLVNTKEEFNNLNISKELYVFYKDMIDNILYHIDNIQAFFDREGFCDYNNTIISDIELLEELKNKNNLLDLLQFLQDIKFKTMARSKDEEKKLFFKHERDKYKDLIKSMKASYKEGDIFLNINTELKELYPFIKEIIRLVKEFNDIYKRKKEELYVLDFSDLEHFTLDILIDKQTGNKTDVAIELSDFFKEVMVDEYQDSNEIQEKILSCIAHNDKSNNYFMVGDVKQSIYGFRSSDPQIFIDKFNKFKDEDKDHIRILLNQNFRSRREVLSFTNDIFKLIMDKDMGKVRYDKSSYLNYGDLYIEDKKNETNYGTEIYYLNPNEEELNLSNCLDTTEYEYLFLASKIQELMNSNFLVQDKDKNTGKIYNRKLKYKDIVILSQSLSDTYGKTTKLLDALKKYDIPSILAETPGYFDTMEISNILSFLEIIDNPYKDIELVAVLSSPMFSISHDTLLNIRKTYPELTFFYALSCFIKDIKDENLDRENKTYYDKYKKDIYSLNHFMDLYNEIKNNPDLSINEIIRKVIKETDFIDTVSAMPGGELKRANIEKLLDEAGSNDNISEDLNSFMQYIRKMKKYKFDIGMANSKGQEDDVVRIMTIHKSKGLEFPVVFLIGCSRKFNDQYKRESLYIDTLLGLSIKKYQKKNYRVLQKTFYTDAFIKLIDKKEKGERQRLLYVALTRAKEKLFLIGLGDYSDKIEAPFIENTPTKISFLDKYKANSFFDWVIDAILKYDLKEKSYNLYKGQLTKEILLNYNKSNEDYEKNKDELINLYKNYDIDTLNKINEIMDYRYHYLNNNMFKNKYTVSELKNNLLSYDEDTISTETDEIDDIFLNKENSKNQQNKENITSFIPKFMLKEEKKENHGSTYGTIIHKILEKLDFSLSYDKDILEEKLISLKEDNVIEEDFFNIVNRNSILKFLNNRLTKELFSYDNLKDKKVYKEKEFVFSENVKNIFGEDKNSEDILIQGAIDLMIVSSKSVIIIDYKTDKLYDDKSFIDKYDRQLKLYGLFASKNFQLKDIKLYIYSLNLDKYIKIESL